MLRPLRVASLLCHLIIYMLTEDGHMHGGISLETKFRTLESLNQGEMLTEETEQRRKPAECAKLRHL